MDAHAGAAFCEATMTEKIDTDRAVAKGGAYAEQVADAVRPLGIALRRIRWASSMGGGTGR